MKVGMYELLVTVMAAVLVFGGVASAEGPKLYIDPIPGLTVGTYAAPPETAIPLGAVVNFRQDMQLAEGDRDQPQRAMVNEVRRPTGSACDPVSSVCPHRSSGLF